MDQEELAVKKLLSFYHRLCSFTCNYVLRRHCDFQRSRDLVRKRLNWTAASIIFTVLTGPTSGI
jgi:hypothetical protein